MLLLVIIGLITWSALAVVGIHRGLHRRLVVFRGWGDVALTGTLIVCTSIGIMSLRQSPEPTVFLPALLAIVPWLWITKTANSGWTSLLFAIPAKLSLLLLLLVCSLLAISSAYTALSRKHDARTRLTHAAIATGFGLATWLLLRAIQQLVRGAAPAARFRNGADTPIP